MDANAGQEHRHSGSTSTTSNTTNKNEPDDDDYLNNKEFKLYKKTTNYKLFRKKEQKLFDELINSLKSIKTKAKQQQLSASSGANANQTASTTSSAATQSENSKTKIKKTKKSNKKKQLNTFKEFSELLASTSQQTAAGSAMPAISFTSADATSIKAINTASANRNDLIKLNKKLKNSNSNNNNNNVYDEEEDDDEELNEDDDEEISEVRYF